MKNTPRDGWKCYDFDDLGAGQTRKCDACGSSTLRYVHHLRHDESGQTLAVGQTCASRLEGDPDAAKRRESGWTPTPLPRRMPVPKAGRAVDWLKNWQLSQNNPENIWKRIGTDFATVFVKDGLYTGVFRDRFTRAYGSQVEVQIALYRLTVRPDYDENAPHTLDEPTSNEPLPF